MSVTTASDECVRDAYFSDDYVSEEHISEDRAARRISPDCKRDDRIIVTVITIRSGEAQEFSRDIISVMTADVVSLIQSGEKASDPSDQ